MGCELNFGLVEIQFTDDLMQLCGQAARLAISQEKIAVDFQYSHETGSVLFGVSDELTGSFSLGSMHGNCAGMDGTVVCGP